ncbi:hypothetical protein SKAU_G00050270 [Synaphobranchus kaupii]|uniref:Ig-like domain-containing protein n=1 Tax=Synaphobranchus kaupii TaxID=118154 RepID=A0A9Q1J9Q2_SYNKA|nr:hypothetical protein SKAU_G00050270 [Synaphobranchus kaupii]
MNFFLTMAYLLLLKAATKAGHAAAGTGIAFHPQTSRLVLLGSNLTLNCSFDIEGKADRVRVKWLVNNNQHSDCKGLKELSSGLANETAAWANRGQVTQSTGHTWSSLTLRDVAFNESGWYFCQVVVEIPDYRKSCSGGIEVIVTSLPRRSPSTRTTAKHTSPAPLPHVNVHWWVWVTVGAGSLILIAIFVGVWILRRRNRPQNKENPIYENMHPEFKSTVQKENPIYENMHPVFKSTGPSQPSPRPRTQLNPLNLPSSVQENTAQTAE